MNGLLKTITLALAGIFLIEFTCSIGTSRENNINSSEPININYTVQSENNSNNSSSNHTLNEQVANNTENKNQSVSSDNAMEMCNQTFQTPKGIRI